MKTTGLLFLFFLTTTAYAKEFEFNFFGFNEKNVRIKWEVYTNSPKGYPESNLRSVTMGSTTIKIDLKKGEKLVIEAYVADNPNKKSLIENRDYNQLLKNSINSINFTVIEKKELKDVLSLPQLVLKIGQDRYANSLVKEKDDILIDKDLPIGTLIFFDGENSYIKPTNGIVTGETNSERLNKYYHRIEDMIMIENNLNVSASTGELGFLKALTTGIDLQSVKFLEFRIEIDNLNKLQAQSFMKDPYDIFYSNSDLWLQAVINKVNTTSDKSKFKLYFVTSKISADKVVLKRRVYKEFKTEYSVEANIDHIVNVGTSGLHHSLYQYEKLDSISNFFVDYEAMDMTIVLLNESIKKAVGSEINNLELFKSSINNEITESKNILQETYKLLTGYSELPEAGSVNQIIAICKDREYKLEKPFELDSIGNKINDPLIIAENFKIQEYNRYLKTIQNEIINYEAKLNLYKGVDVKILQLKTNSNPEITKDTKIISIENYVLKNLISGLPGA